ncbi:uncharacterized protein LOC126743575 [Anthonomus grandis grandis]|uniref:uncharacterized protein LOC126743575 n=1 Tax=Anthonomus grandis grandis TaxID=2921223 RepID=UPI002165F499|nr:uncharacterized protein LOC126743575 [Anthonomus grandis grandis]
MTKKGCCVVPNCRNGSEKTCGTDVIYQKIPPKEKIRRRWIRAIEANFDDFVVDTTTSIRVCSDHFETGQIIIGKNGKKSVQLDAVPTIFIKHNVVKKKEKDPDPIIKPRHQSRRAASKEALKQMQILLEDEDDAVEIPDDDYVYKGDIKEEPVTVPVVPPPTPKKKYKLTHRKSSDGNDREVLVLKSIKTPNITNHSVENNLELECWVEELEPCQKERNQKLQDEEKELQNKLDELIKSCKGEVIFKGELTTIIEVSEHVHKTIQAVKASQNTPPPPPIVINSMVASPQPGYQVLGYQMANPTNQTKISKIQVAKNLQAPPPPVTTSVPTTPVNRTSRTMRGKATPQTATRSTASATPVATRSAASSPVATRTATLTPVATRSTAATPVATRSAAAATPVATRSAAATPVATRSAVASPVGTRSAVASSVGTRSAANATVATRSAAAAATPPVGTRSAAPVTARAAAAITPVATRSGASAVAVATRSAGTKRPAVTPPPPVAPPATRSRGSTVTASTSLPKPTESSVEGGLLTGTNIKPKAVVDLTADDGRPLPDSKEVSFNKLQGKTFPSLVVVARPQLRVENVNSDRAKLDSKVKSVLMCVPAKFTEWLIQQGLVKSEQRCTTHPANQLKLGMYSDVSKFPYSGGYVWISECCPQKFVSVFSGSIFEGSPHPPLVILKLLYHWSCQTNIQNVVQWVKVDNLYIKGMYTWLRSICSLALQTHMRKLGGPNIRVELGVISLGTTSQDGNSRQVKVEVLGVLETTTKLLRLRAIEPLADGDRNYKKRFAKILEPIVHWVHNGSTIVTDLTVDKSTLCQLGFNKVVQHSTANVDESNTNKTIMEYLRKIVPRMFQNALSLLSRQIIQQFLDELVWREWFGNTSLQAFDNLVAHVAEQTKFECNQSLIVKLSRVAQNPFKQWNVPSVTVTSSCVPPPPTPQVPVKTAEIVKKRKRKDTEPLPKAASAVSAEICRPPKSNSPDVPTLMVPLENYYYGTIDNYPPKMNVKLSIKCPVCKEVFTNNIVLMNHLFKHAHSLVKDGEMCRYCLTSLPTQGDLLAHIATLHPSETKHDNGFICLICETQYMNPFILGKHMSKEHCPAELPYQCGTCGYRCSNHKQAIDHFYKQHDNGPTIQCPFCLKSTTVFSSSRNMTQNMHFFIQHLQKHQKKTYAKRCGKCNLWFVQKEVLKEHYSKMHASQRGKTGLVPWTAPRNGVMVPKSKMDKYPSDGDVINFSTLFYNVTKGLKCKECNQPMDTNKHFASYENCQNPNCQYATCCANAMQDHNSKCNKINNGDAPCEKLPYKMFCICGFSSEDGNQIAKHLAICEKKSAYPSLSDAKSASVTHSMLDVLGLVRKPDETERKPSKTTKKVIKKVDTDEADSTSDTEVRKRRKLNKEDAAKTENKVPEKGDKTAQDDPKCEVDQTLTVNENKEKPDMKTSEDESMPDPNQQDTEVTSKENPKSEECQAIEIAGDGPTNEKEATKECDDRITPEETPGEVEAASDKDPADDEDVEFKETPAEKSEEPRKENDNILVTAEDKVANQTETTKGPEEKCEEEATEDVLTREGSEDETSVDKSPVVNPESENMDSLNAKENDDIPPIENLDMPEERPNEEESGDTHPESPGSSVEHEPTDADPIKLTVEPEEVNQTEEAHEDDKVIEKVDQEEAESVSQEPEPNPENKSNPCSPEPDNVQDPEDLDKDDPVTEDHDKIADNNRPHSPETTSLVSEDVKIDPQEDEEKRPHSSEQIIFQDEDPQEDTAETEPTIKEEISQSPSEENPLQDDGVAKENVAIEASEDSRAHSPEPASAADNTFEDDTVAEDEKPHADENSLQGADVLKSDTAIEPVATMEEDRSPSPEENPFQDSEVPKEDAAIEPEATKDALHSSEATDLCQSDVAIDPQGTVEANMEKMFENEDALGARMDFENISSSGLEAMETD